MNPRMDSKQHTIIKRTCLSIGSIAIILAALEICRRNQIYEWKWVAKPNIEFILFCSLFINFNQVLFVFTKITLKEYEFVPDCIRTCLYLCITYLLTVSWLALLLGFFDTLTINWVQTVMRYLEFTCIPVSIYVCNFFIKTYFNIIEDSKKHYKSSLTDPLTKLPNRVLFYDRLNQLLLNAERHKRVIAVMFLDLDDFKQINDKFGHLAGDQLLCVVAQRLLECIRKSDTVSRLGGDEFTVILPEVGKIKGAETIAKKIVNSLTQPIEIEGKGVFITVSIGISIFPFDGDTPETIVNNADLALYSAKKMGKNNFQIYNSSMKQ